MIDEGFKCADHLDDDFQLQKYLTYLNKIPVQIFLLLLITVLLYANTINAPFYLDDFPSIVENPAVHNLDNIGAIWQFSKARFIGYLSFAFNYAETSTTGYHLFNIGLHFLSGVAVLFLFRGLLFASNQTLYLSTLPLLGALLFITAPLQTQAVTYIVQRLTSMAALFYIAAMTCFVYARLKQQIVLFLPVLLFALLAFFTKQNTATLPFALLLIELIFFQKFSSKLALSQWKKYLSFTLLAIVIVIFSLLLLSGFDLQLLDKISRDPQTIGRISRIDYFSTQLLALWHYIYLFFVPLTLHIDYDFPLQQSFFSGSTLMALLAHIGVITMAFLFRKKQPLVLFAVLFFYLAHAIESSFIPIFDVFFEHRAYLPNLGMALLTASGMAFLLQKYNHSYWVWAMIFSVLIGFSYLTFKRNYVWNNPIELYQLETQYSPEKERVWAVLGKYYLKNKQYNEALQNLGKALNLGREGNTLNALPTTFLNTYFALLYTNQLDKASYMASLVPVEQLTPHDRGVFYFMRGNHFSMIGNHSEAMNYFQHALVMNPGYLDAKTNLAAMHLVKKDVTKAKQLLDEVLAIKPSHKMALHYVNQIQQLQQGRQ